MGVEICIRPLRADDREREVAFINSLSERSRYFRLFTPLRFLPPHLLDQLMEIDYQPEWLSLRPCGTTESRSSSAWRGMPKPLRPARRRWVSL